MTQIGIVGSGNVGANAAFFAAEKNIAPVLMHDIKEGLSIGKALDMMEAAPVRNYQFPVNGTDILEDVLQSDIVIIAAGKVREPGMKRPDLYPENSETLKSIAAAFRDYRGVVVIATEPIDPSVALFVSETGLPWQRVIGTGCALDGLRLRYLISRELQVDMNSVDATIIGPHSDDMIALAGYTTVSGIPIGALLETDRIAALVEETRNAGDTILDHFKRATSYYGPAAVAVDIAEAVIRDSHRVLSVSFALNGQLGVKSGALSLPAVIGRSGIDRVMEPRISDDDLEKFSNAAAIAAAHN